MQTINPENPLIIALHAAIRQELGGTNYAITGPHDTVQKKTAVFVLGHWFDAKQRPLCEAYNMAFYYVPTVVNELSHAYAVNERFAGIVNRILNYIETHGAEKASA
jgi:hypothetical protein